MQFHYNCNAVLCEKEIDIEKYFKIQRLKKCGMQEFYARQNENNGII